MIKYIISDMLSMLSYLPDGILLGLPLSLIIMTAMRKSYRSKGRRLPWICGSLLGIYITILVIITLFSREAGSREGIDLQLLSTWGINARNNAYVVENVLLFIPFGILVCLVFRDMRNPVLGMCLGFVCSLSIECIQLVSKRGYFQIDDIVTNVLGMMIGYFVFWIFRKIVGAVRHAFFG